MVEKKLILRLSSLGDVILASAVLEVFSKSDDQPLEWVIAEEFRGLLENHPKIRRLFTFRRSRGLRAWIHLCRELWEERYHEVYDLHRSLRTRILQFLFFYWSIRECRPFPIWKTVPKHRLRLMSYFLFKRSLPKGLRPQSMVQRYAQVAGGTGQERPNLTHLIQKEKGSKDCPQDLSKVLANDLPSDLIEKAKSFQGRYLCVMPSSRWDGKKWPVAQFEEALARIHALPVVLGTSRDKEGFQLCERLAASGAPFYSGIGKWDYSQTATVMSHSQGFLGVDTGLAHLSEAVGVPVVTLFGPTVPDMGFGPWRLESRAIESSLWCSPCGKDGRFCFRRNERYLCMKQITAERVIRQLGEIKPYLTK